MEVAPMGISGNSILCHCGNQTTIVVHGHCLLCRCDEHSAKRPVTDHRPGCGPRCVLCRDERVDRTKEILPKARNPLGEAVPKYRWENPTRFATRVAGRLQKRW